jgi:hypothetical protein
MDGLKQKDPTTFIERTVVTMDTLNERLNSAQQRLYSLNIKAGCIEDEPGCEESSLKSEPSAKTRINECLEQSLKYLGRLEQRISELENFI